MYKILKTTRKEENKLIELMENHWVGDSPSVGEPEREAMLQLCKEHNLLGTYQDIKEMDHADLNNYLMNTIYEG